MTKSELPLNQIIALQNFVNMAQDRLVANQIDRDEGRGWPMAYHWFDTFLATPNGEAVIQITSYGPPEAVRSTGMFIYVHTLTDGEANLVFSLQTPKSIFSVNDGVARKLSTYKPEQFDLVRTLINISEPIGSDAYHALIRGKTPQAK